MAEKFEALHAGDVISTSGSSLMFQCTFKVSEFMTIIHSKLEEESLFSEGIDCEVLSPGKQWRKGKIQLRLEFCPDEEEA
ncbi:MULTISPECIES: KGK domain-containing protein [Planktothricoides]|uniref:KGK domain-containing protein n=2 Tax=Planktothricoides raciborskii TaxID=132608 RepID=A0AAU8JG74_9CYAN|nr:MULTISPECIES: KGK domain-containing protein [Planktothricoides]KOR35213.1 KGK domain-containing protein [Planktothricoides sp. SR001]MBD2544821.1 KGK domain-containing protein [Planktothricoides raciborskii FACHB-1370]MBD2582772.1 KGK domain-containing protein [Planktothricoides raciborskii FACHB-1261]